MENYRITKATAYDGCIPITVYVVQKCTRGFLVDKWINIRAFQDKKKAISLLELLKR